METAKEENKSVIWQNEQKNLVQWFKTVSSGIFRNVVALAKIYVLQKKASSVKAILTEFRDAEGHAAIHYAANLGSNEICEWILDEAPECLEMVDEVGDTPLSYACLGNHMETVTFLVSKGANVNAYCKGRSPIQIACGNSSQAIIEFLLSNGADLSLGTDSEIGTPLHWSVGEHRLDITRLLLAQNVDINAVNRYGVTPLIMASAGTDASMIQLLLDHHADPTIALDDNITPLHIAVEGNHVESVKPFLTLPQAEQLANLSTTRTHLKPVHFAVEVKSLEIVRLLVPLTAEYKGESAEEVMKKVQMQFDAEKAKTEMAAKPKPKPQLSAFERRVCDKKLRDAKAAMAAHDYQRAADLLSEAIAINPLSENLFVHRCNALLELERWKEAEQDAKKAVELSPQWAKAHLCLGNAYFKQGLYVDAATTYYRGCELAPANKELSMKFQEALEVGKRERQREMMEAKERTEQ